MVTIELISGSDGAGTGNVTGPLGTTDNALVQFSGTTGRIIKASTQSGIVKVASGVVSMAVAGTDYAAGSHVHAAADITSGIVSTARLGTGTANTTTFLRGDQTWSTPTASSSIIIQAGDVTVDSAASTIDFDNTDFSVTSSPAGEANISLTGTFYRKASFTHPQIETSGTTPSFTKGVNAGTTGVITIVGNDTCGNFSVTPGGTGIAAGMQFTFTFATARPDANFVVLVQESSSATVTVGRPRVSTRTNTGFDVIFPNAPVSGTSYSYFYWIVEY